MVLSSKMEKINGQSARYNQIVQLKKKNQKLLIKGRTQRHVYVYLCT